MSKRTKIARRESKIIALGMHLQNNLLMLSGHQPVIVPQVRLQQFVPILVLLVCVGLMAGSVRARDSFLVNLAILTSRAFLLRGEGDDLEG